MKKEAKMNKRLIIGTAVGIVIGLALGIFVSIIFNLPSSFHTGAGIGNQVQVSGKVSETQNGTIKFVSLNRTIVTNVPITSGKYSVLLVGGTSYDVYVYLSSTDYYDYDFSLYVPLGVTTFTANF